MNILCTYTVLTAGVFTRHRTCGWLTLRIFGSLFPEHTKFKPFRQHKQVSRGKKNKKLDSNLLLLSCFLPLTPTIPLATGLHILNGEFKKRRRRRRKQRGLNLNFYFFLRGHSNKYCDLIGSWRSSYFPISAHGHGNAFVSHREHPQLRCHSSQNKFCFSGWALFSSKVFLSKSVRLIACWSFLFLLSNHFGCLQKTVFRNKFVVANVSLNGLTRDQKTVFN